MWDLEDNPASCSNAHVPFVVQTEQFLQCNSY